MKKSKFVFAICLLSLLLQAAAGLILLANIWKLGIVPDSYLYLLAAVLGVLLLITAAAAFVKLKRPVGKARRVIASVLALLITLACTIGCFVTSQLRNTIDNMITQEPSGIPVAVFVEKDDPAKTAADAKNYIFAVVSGYETERTNYTIQAIEEQLQCQLTVEEFPSVFDMVDSLLAKKVGALVLNPAYVDILEEMEGYADFSDKTRILCEILTPEQLSEGNVTDETVSVTTEPVEEITEPVQLGITERPFVIYLSGTDTKAKVFRTCRSDVNIIAVVNPVTHQVLLLNTPRDYYVPNPAGNDKLDKLTHCGLYGVENSVLTLSRLYNIPIDYHARINFSGFEKLIDAIGGITVYSTASFKAIDDVYVQKGNNTFNGKQALSFARERYHVAGGDNGRGKNQMKVITAVINKLTSSTALISNYPGILDSLGDMFTMSVPSEDVSALIKMQLENMPKWELFSFAVTGVNARAETYSMPGRKLSVMHIGEEYVTHASELVNRLLAGERIQEADLEMNKS